MKEYKITVSELFGHHIEECFVADTFKNVFDFAMRTAKAEYYYTKHVLPVVAYVWDGLDIIASFTVGAGWRSYGRGIETIMK